MFRNREDIQLQEVRFNEEINLLQDDIGRDELSQTFHVRYFINYSVV